MFYKSKFHKLSFFAENQHQGSGVYKFLLLVVGLITKIIHQIRQYNDLGHKKTAIYAVFPPVVGVVTNNYYICKIYFIYLAIH